MKHRLWRASAAAFAAALAGSAACGSGGSSGCGGTNLNSNSAVPSYSAQCGAGTYLNSAQQCVPLSSNSNTGTAAPPKAITQ